MLRFCYHLFLTLWLGFLAAVVIQCHRPEDWSKIKGLDASSATPPNLLERMEQTVFRKNAPLELSEADINLYITSLVQGKQAGLSQKAATFERVAFDFEPGSCRVCLSWRFENTFTSTAALEFKLERKGNQFIITPTKGALGSLPVNRGIASILLPPMQNLSQVLSEELRTLFQMNQIRFEKDKLVLHPLLETAK